MKKLEQWLKREAARQAREVPLEEALLGDRSSRYARYRLRPFAFATLLGLAVHLFEFLVLSELLAQRRLVQSLMVQNGCALAYAFYWGGLEVMRRRVREAPTRALGAVETGRWLGLSVIVAACVMLFSIPQLANQHFGVYRAYVFVCLLRLALDIVTRTFYSGVYAVSRVRRPFWVIVLSQVTGIVSMATLWPWLGAFAFPTGLAVATLASRGLLVYYTLGTYRHLGILRPKLRFGLGHFRPLVGRTLTAGLAGMSMRVGSVIVVGAIAGRMRSQQDYDETVLALHVVAPLLSAAAGWSQTFYLDFCRLDTRLTARFFSSLVRRLLWAGAWVGGLSWVAAVATLAFFLGDDWWSFFAALLPVFVSLAWLAPLSLSHVSQARFVTVAAGGAVAAISVLALPRIQLAWAVLALAVPNLVVIAWLSRPRAPELQRSGLQATLAGFVAVLLTVRKQVRVGQIGAAQPNVRPMQLLAQAIAARLGDNGAVVVVRSRIVWFELQTDTPLDNVLLAKMGAGAIKKITLTPFAQGGEAAISTAAGLGIMPTLGEPQQTGLIETFHSLVANGLVLDIGVGLPALEHRSLWRLAIARAHKRKLGRNHGAHDVYPFAPNGTIERLFLVPRGLERGVRQTWEAALDTASWQATLASLNDRAMSRTLKKCGFGY